LNKNISLCLHGHFYQPPRENAWTGEIETQPSASPFHDWNERILQESYKPNSEAVITDEHDKVTRRVNNYEYFNFDFGPALLQWIQKKHSKTYEKIVEADRRSMEIHSGHGNAIAMIYNHIIMPLANTRDKITQIKWAVEDFRIHFHREPEGMWLPETACNQETIDILAAEKIKYIILDPSQADKIRKIHKGKWKDVSNGSIATGKSPYRCYAKNSKTDFVDIFFYDGPLSKNIAFDDHIYDSHRLMNRLNHSGIHFKDQLLSVAVDGETFGHHKHYTERTMSYLFSELLPDSEYSLVNFGEYLEKHPPEHEVMIKAGKDNEGTSWSCPHGVGRWKENCGCSQSDEFPSQKWRQPLRDSLDWLRDELASIYENSVSDLFKDPWAARNDYIRIILDPAKDRIEEFFFFNSKRFLDGNETNTCLNLLEMQRFSMLMFTSCGWFFSDISGIETLQIIQYAARAIEIAKVVSGIDLEPEFLHRLSAAKSNVKKFKDGKDLYLKKIKRV